MYIIIPSVAPSVTLLDDIKAMLVLIILLAIVAVVDEVVVDMPIAIVPPAKACQSYYMNIVSSFGPY